MVLSRPPELRILVTVTLVLLADVLVEREHLVLQGRGLRGLRVVGLGLGMGLVADVAAQAGEQLVHHAAAAFARRMSTHRRLVAVLEEERQELAAAFCTIGTMRGNKEVKLIN